MSFFFPGSSNPSGKIGLYGFEEFSQILQKLPARVQFNVARTSVFRVAQQIRDEAKANLLASGYMRSDRKLYRSIKAVRGRTTRDGQVVARVGSKVRYAHLIELGHMVHNGKNVMHFPGVPFLQNALYRNKEQLLSMIKTALVNELEKKYQKFGLGSLPPALDEEE